MGTPSTIVFGVGSGWGVLFNTMNKHNWLILALDFFLLSLGELSSFVDASRSVF
jgi:hypothetical protein